MSLRTTGLLAALLGGLTACAGDPPAAPPAVAPPPPAAAAPVQDPLTGDAVPTLLLTQAQFGKGPDGRSKPGAALLTLWRSTAEGWKASKLEDADSNVFHKALVFEGGILTLGAEGAYLKKWTFADGKWAAEELWHPTWEGKFNRLRDLEVGDVNGDGIDDLVVATHDSGVVGVGSRVDGKLVFTELDKAADTFVHEIEIGDIDGDGKKEFFATPSARNKSSGESQPGQVVMYRWDGETYRRSVVDGLEKSHAKEILAVDLDGKGTSTLFSVIEAETQLENGAPKVIRPVEIRRYALQKDGTFTHEVAASIQDRQTRFLVPGDFDGDGKLDLAACAMKSGIWMVQQGEGGKWTSTNIELASSGFEHACYAADLDRSGTPELYVASDNERQVRSYTWNATTKTYDKAIIGSIPGAVITWNITAGILGPSEIRALSPAE